MTWKVIHWSVNFLFWIALALVLASSIVSNRRNATVHANGKVSAVVRDLGVDICRGLDVFHRS
jgi:hypothetical protein